jgi:hypothetical protein
MKYLGIGVSIIATVALGVSNANAADPVDACTQVYKDNIRDYSIDQRSSASLDALYDHVCSSATKNTSSATNAAFEAVIKATPVKGSYNNAETYASTDQFCKTYQRNTLSTDEHYQRTNTIQVSALRSFNECIAGSSKALAEYHLSPNKDVLTISITPNQGTEIALNSIGFDTQKISCDRSPLKPATGKDTLSSNTPLHLSCRRVATTSPATSRTGYPAATVTVDTSAQLYQFPVFPSEIAFGVDAQALEGKVAQLSGALSSSSATQNDLVNRLNVEQDVSAALSAGRMCAVKVETNEFCDNGIAPSGVYAIFRSMDSSGKYQWHTQGYACERQKFFDFTSPNDDPDPAKKLVNLGGVVLTVNQQRQLFRSKGNTKDPVGTIRCF